MATVRTRVNRQRLRFSRRLVGLLVISLVVTVAAVGCVTADVDLSNGTPAAGATDLPVALAKPRATRSPYLPPERTVSSTEDPSSGRNHSAAVTLSPGAAVGPGSRSTSVDTALTIHLTILAPTQGAALDVGAIRVLGMTGASSQVTVNGIPTEVSPDGSFTRDLILGEGVNSVEAVARDPSGREVSESLVLLFMPRAEGVPLSILFPQGLEVSDPDLTIMGATRPDAVVGVNGVLVDINNVGIFSTNLVLEEGTNLIEIVAVDLDENVNYQTVVVFYIP